MCGIIGYSGYRPAVSLLVEGLHRLEYRGYDSAGVAVLQGESIGIRKAKGRLSNLKKLMEERKISLDAGQRANVAIAKQYGVSAYHI